MNTRRQHGFTLWELLMTLLVAGILLGIGVPNVMEFQRNGAMTAAANNLVTGILMARNEAVKRQAPVTLCLSDNPTAVAPVCAPNAVTDSTRGFIVYVDENNNLDANGARILTDATDGNAVVDANELLLMQSAGFAGTTMLVSANCGHITYLPSGFPRAVPGLCAPTTRAVLFCDDRGRRVTAGSLSAARNVRIDRAGRGMVQPETAQIANAIAGQLNPFGVNPTCPP
jgi:type IV fimbrial biogenesis protein FimT